MYPGVCLIHPTLCIFCVLHLPFNHFELSFLTSKQRSEWDCHRNTIQIIIIPRHNIKVEKPSTEKLQNTRLNIAPYSNTCREQPSLGSCYSFCAVCSEWENPGARLWVFSVTLCCSHQGSNTGGTTHSHSKVVMQGWLNGLEVSALVRPAGWRS